MKKEQWIDVLKGIGIITVVACHVFAPGPMVSVMLLLNMPVFFFLSGFLFRVRTDAGAFAIEKAIHLLVPYVMFVALIYGPYIIFRVFVRHIGTEAALSTIGDVLMGGRSLTGFGAPFWFVPCLFLTQQCMNLLMGRFSPRVVIGVLLAAYSLSFVNSLVYPEFWLPLDANVVLAAAPLFYLGVMVRAGKLELASLVLWALALGGVVLAALGVNNKYDMKWANYGLPVVTLASSFCIVLVLIKQSKWLCGVRMLGPVLALLGEASLIIMFTHQCFQLALLAFGWPGVARLCTAIALPTLAYLVMRKNAYARALLMGSKQDFVALFGRSNRVHVV